MTLAEMLKKYRAQPMSAVLARVQMQFMDHKVEFSEACPSGHYLIVDGEAALTRDGCGVYWSKTMHADLVSFHGAEAKNEVVETLAYKVREALGLRSEKLAPLTPNSGPAASKQRRVRRPA